MRHVISPVFVVAPFAERLLIRDLPHLPSDRRAAAVDVVVARVAGLPSVTRAGALLIGIVHRLLLVLPATAPVSDALARVPLPFLGDYPRLVRSLAYASIWERWPDTPVSP
ncbi:MAG: hypothetical protein ACO3S5_05575 [Ilumatobacteraceae bacterium]|jgi:hypothetical protein